jgi:hypothetical protein
MATVFLRLGDDPVTEAQWCLSKGDAIDTYRRQAQALARHEQVLTGSIHIAPTLDQVVEDADFILSLGPRGGVKVEKA